MSPRAASPPTIVSPKAGTGFQMPQAPAGRGSSPALDQPASAEPTQPERRVLTRGRTAPLAPAPKDAPAPAPPIARVAAPAAPVVAATPAFTAGTRVLVQWANGQKYPGVVERVSGPQCLVRFDAGEQRWVEARFALPVR
jgi:hypothetical protein